MVIVARKVGCVDLICSHERPILIRPTFHRIYLLDESNCCLRALGVLNSLGWNRGHEQAYNIERNLAHTVISEALERTKAEGWVRNCAGRALR